MSEAIEPVFGETVWDEAIRTGGTTALNRVFDRTHPARAVGVPSPQTISPMFQRDAGEAGFEPLATVRVGFAPPLSSDNFVGPEGYVVFQIYPRTGNSYLMTYFSDGTAVVTASKAGAERRTQYLLWMGSFRESYEAHLAACAAKCANSPVRPIRRNTVEDLLAGWRIAHLVFFTPGNVALALLVNAALLGSIVYVIYTLIITYAAR